MGRCAYAWLAGVLLWAVSGVAVAAPLVIADDTSLDRLPLNQHILMYTGHANPANTRMASDIPDADYRPVGSGSPLGLMQTHWFRFSIRNTSSATRKMVLDFDQALYSRIDWRSQTGGDVREYVTGQSLSYETRDIHYNYFAFRLQVPPGETITVDFSIYTPYAALFVPVLSDEDRFYQRQPQLWQFSGAVFGMLYSVLLCLILYVAKVPRLGAAHAMMGQVFFSMLSVLYLSGVIQSWLPDGETPWRDIAYVLIHVAQGSCYALAVRSFFQTSQYYPSLNIVLLLMVAAGLLLVAALPLANVELLAIATLAINFFSMMASFVVAILSLVRRQQGTTIFAVGLILFVLIAWVSVLGTTGVLPGGILTRYGYELGLTVQADVLFFAIAVRFFAIEREQLALQEQMLRLDAEMKARSEFVERVTHDIKSPLSAVIGAAQLLRDKQDASARQNYLDIIQRSCSMVIGIIDDILTHSRLKASGLSLRNQIFDLRELISSIEASTRASQQAQHVQFTAKVSEDIPAELYGDRLRLGQLLNNLLTNAFKFTDEGRVSLSVELGGRYPDGVDIRFIVQDTGIGMSSEFLQQAFNPYTREEAGKGYRQGFGLGLSICRQLVDLMGGSIDVLSAVGQGTRFTVVIPFALQGD